MEIFIISVLLTINVFNNAQEVVPEDRNNTVLIRLQGGDKPNEGRVEIFHGDSWGTVCDDGWNINGASVVCRMLGYEGALEYIHSGKFGPGEGPIWLDEVSCTGDENNIVECSSQDWGNHDCSHHEDAGVKCNPRKIPGFHLYNQVVQGVDIIRLKAPKGHRHTVPQYHGFVEIFHQDKWHKVCSTSWNQQTANVICGQLGFPAAEKIRNKKTYLSRSKRRHHYWLTNVTCSGVETELSQCRFDTFDISGLTLSECKDGEPLVLQCFVTSLNNHGKNRGRKYKKGRQRKLHQMQVPGTIRLKAGSSMGEGRLEVKRNGRWGTVCHRGFNLLAANVACKELGFGTAKRELRNSFFGKGHGPIWLTNVRCTGNETRLADCLHDLLPNSVNSYEDISSEVCSHHEDIGVSCHMPQLNIQSRVRIVGGRNPMEGRIEVKMRKKWGPVCSDDWTAKEAMVACRQLGLGFALHALKEVYFFPGSVNATNIMMTGLKCSGNEMALHMCKHDGKNLSVCGAHSRSLTPFAGVICTELTPDLIQDIPLLQQSIHIDDQPLHNLYCAAEENCLAPSASKLNWPYGSRRLLRFSTRVWNRGRADFRPARSQDQWIWHQCHGHYHSMAEFTHYDILDLNFTEVAEGHKASFCLEDSQCDPDVSPRFDCDQPGGGVQGIAVGCSDNYQYNIDCQWIDISDVKRGNYLIRYPS
ncbi:unnamed protein product [Clavelina lepadiformis]|uniref:SRCR domain-containing protein n=1 Tax=Clavelina lepadiformis TaxID=159417 RepID=A0ABP0G454_CLALP